MWQTRTQILAVVLCAILHALVFAQSPPRITKQPPSNGVFYLRPESLWFKNAKPLVLQCEAEGEPTPKYRWIINGKKSELQDNGTLTMTHLGAGDEGQYQCFAENEHGIATSNSVTVRKAEFKLAKDKPPKSALALEGKSFKLLCQPPDGTPAPDIQWIIKYKDGNVQNIDSARITVDPVGNLHFTNVTREDESGSFHYVCVVSSDVLGISVYANQYTLNVAKTGLSPSKIRHAPIQQYVTKRTTIVSHGKRVELFCIYGGTPLPETTWKKNDVPVKWNDRITKGHYGKSLIIHDAMFHDAGKYTCEVTNGVGAPLTYSMNLQLQSAPYFVIEPRSQYAAENEDVEFECESSGIPDSEVEWIHNGSPITDASKNPRLSIQNHKMIITDLKPGDTGNYGCKAVNSVGNAYKDVYLNVLDLMPQITVTPRDEITVDGRHVTMRCRVFGAPFPEVQWTRNGLAVTGEQFVVQANGDLLIKNVDFDDAGDYTCQAQNKLGGADATGTLVVKDHTRITDEPENCEATVGTTVTFHCAAATDSSFNLKIKWLRNGKEIDFDKEPRFAQTQNNSLTIAQTGDLDSGEYTCVAQSELDEDRASATLVVQNVPNAPLITHTECNSNGATISWLPKGDNRAPIIHYLIQYKTTFTPDIWNIASDKIPADVNSFEVPISPWTNYTLRVIAVNKIGSSPPSDASKICATEPDVPHKNPDNVKAEGTTPTNLVVTWTCMPQIDHNGPRFHYRVYWRLDSPDEKWNFVDIFDWKRDVQFILDQPTFARYRIKVVAINEYGESATTDVEHIGYSGEGRPTQAPTSFGHVEWINPTSAVFSWDPIDLDTIHGHFKGYKIHIWSDPDNEEDLRQIRLDGSKNNVLVNDLRPNTIYYARILAYNRHYNGPSSAVIDFSYTTSDNENTLNIETIPRLGGFL